MQLRQVMVDDDYYHYRDEAERPYVSPKSEEVSQHWRQRYFFRDKLGFWVQHFKRLDGNSGSKSKQEKSQKDTNKKFYSKGKNYGNDD